MKSGWESPERIVEKPSALLAMALRAATLATLVAALFGTVGGAVAEVAGIAAIAIVVTAPLARVLFLAVRWLRTGDRRFAFAAAVLLTVVLGGAALALVGR